MKISRTVLNGRMTGRPVIRPYRSGNRQASEQSEDCFARLLIGTSMLIATAGQT